MENNPKIDSFLKQSLIDKDNKPPIVPQNIENKIFQQFRASSKKSKNKVSTFKSIQQIAAMLVLFFGGILTGWWLNVPRNQKNHVNAVRKKSNNPEVKIAERLMIQKPQPNPIVNQKLMADKKETQKLNKQSAKISKNHTEMNHQNKANQTVENQLELPSMLTLLPREFEKMKFPSDKMDMAKKENQKTREMIQVFKFVSL